MTAGSVVAGAVSGISMCCIRPCMYVRMYTAGSVVAGAVSGFTSGTVALPGPPLILFCALARVNSADMRVSVFPLGLVSNFVRIGAMVSLPSLIPKP